MSKEKKDLDIGKYRQDEYVGEIVGVKVMRLANWLATKHNPLTEEQMKDWNNLDRDHVCVTIKTGARVVTSQFMVPNDAGAYQRTNLKKFVDKNGLPDHIADWGGKEVKLRLTSQGFMDVAL